MMNNTEVIKGIDLLIEGLTVVKKALSISEVVAQATEEEPKAKSVAKKEKAPINPPVEEKQDVADGEVMTGKFDIEDLKSMKYNDFKKLAASLGVKCTGTRDEIMERIMALDDTSTTDDTVEKPVEDVAEEKPTKSAKSGGSKKFGKKKVDEPTKDEFDEQAEEIAKETDVEEIIEALADVEIKATKKNAVQKLAEALRAGLIELGADDEEETEVVEQEDEAGDDNENDEITATSYFPQFDPKGYNNPKGMSEERADAIESKMDEILTAYSDGDLTDEDVSSYVEDNATDEEIDLLGDDYDEEDIFKLYMELVKRTIDNGGEEHEQGEPYEVADKDVCCGRELKYIKKTKKYVCEHCGTEYEAE